MVKNWVQRDGSLIEIKKMSDSHLLNSIAMLRRSGLDKSTKQWVPVESLLSGPAFANPDSMASYFYDQFVDEALENDGYQETRPKSKYWASLIAEAKRRGLKVKS